MNATETRRAIRALFPGFKVAMQNGTFDYLHQGDNYFGRRSVPCIYVKVTSEEYHLSNVSDRRIYHHPASTDVVKTLRDAGLCAEHTHAHEYGVVVMLAEREAWPVNTALGLGSWHRAAA